MFNQKVTILISLLILGALNLYAGIAIKQSEQYLEIKNNKISLNIAKGNQGAILAYLQADGLRRAVTLNIVQQNNAAFVNSVKIVKNTPELTVAEVWYACPGGRDLTVIYSVKDDFEYIEAETDFAQGMASITAGVESEALVLPDFLADSIVQYPAKTDRSKFNIPWDNHILVNMIGGGDAILVLLWDSPQLAVSESQDGKCFDSISLSADLKIKFMLGVVAARGMWYKTNEELNSSYFTELNWKPPFPAEWKLVTLLDNGIYSSKSTSESWTLIEKGSKERLESGVGMINSSIWQAWASNLGGFIYPCYFLKGKTFVKKTIFASLNRQPVFADSPCLIFALNGRGNTPATVNMPKKVLTQMLPKEVRNSIEAINSPNNKYPATCGITEEVEKIFYRGESIKEKKQIINKFGRMNMFVLTIRERIEQYVAWQQQMEKMLEEQKRISPQLDPVANELEKELSQIIWAYAKAKDNMKTPQYCKTLTEKIIALCDSKLSDEDKEEQCKELGRQIRIIGGAQDGLLGVYRSVVKNCRQYATVKLMKSSSTAEKELLKNFRHETSIILNNRLGMEGK